MSEVFPLIDGFVGYGDGQEAQLLSDVAWDSSHPLVQARPELFTKPAKEQEPELPDPFPPAATPAKKAAQKKAAG